MVQTCVAVGKRGEPLDMHAEQPGEDLGLGLAQLREREATCWTGQCPWHSWTPPVPIGRTLAA